MGAVERLAPLVGVWMGTNRLWLDADKAADESPSRLEVATVARGMFVSFAYTWVHGGQEQQGLFVVGRGEGEGGAKAFWVDSFHMGHAFWQCEGGENEQGGVAVQGTYPAPPGPDWGWRIAWTPLGDGTLRLAMTNIWPEGREDRAVEALYVRA